MLQYYIRKMFVMQEKNNGRFHYSFIGSLMINVEPSFGLDLTEILPPCFRMAFFDIDRPKPLPPVSRLRALSTR